MESFALQAGRMFDGLRSSGPVTVVVEKGRVARVDPSGGTPPDGLPLIDLGADACLLPGLIDAHVHLAFNAGPDVLGDVVAADDDELLAGMRKAADQALRAGITTVRDLGDRNFLALRLRTELEQRVGSGPEIIAAGPPITTTGGHCYFLGGEAEGEAALLAAVRERHERGCQVVKIMASGGKMTPGSAAHKPQYSSAELRLVVREAHRLGLPVAVHAHAPASIQDALDAGADTIEHVTFLREDGLEVDEAILARAATSDTYLSLTLGYVVPTAEGGSAVAPEALAFTKTYGRLAEKLVESGARIVAGTDAGVAPFKPHDVLPHAVAELVSGGLTPLAALTTVTSVAAQACGVADRKGRIAVGADADLLVVNANPLHDVSRLRDVRAVFRAGVRVR
ncbi:amidohydrolase family protein [Micromonospora musae]|uniref:amidohydrolase family protein n=1 Tax=Micromonospora musae TaxID=1894970 RepID=UPI00342B6AAF